VEVTHNRGAGCTADRCSNAEPRWRASELSDERRYPRMQTIAGTPVTVESSTLLSLRGNDECVRPQGELDCYWVSILDIERIK